jgi:hypothetical protein
MVIRWMKVVEYQTTNIGVNGNKMTMFMGIIMVLV